MAAETACGASRGRPWPAPATTTQLAVGQRRRQPLAERDELRSSRCRRAPSPASSSSARRSHSGAIAPRAHAAQRRRPARAGRCAAGPRARCGRPSGGVPANSGCAAQRSANCSMVAVLGEGGERARRRRGAPRGRPRPRCPRWWRRARAARCARAPPARRAARSARPSSSRRGRSARARRPARRPRRPRSSPAARRARRRGRAGRAPGPYSVRDPAARPPDPRRAPSRRSRAGGRRWWASAAHLDRDHRHLPPAARLRRRAGALRPGRRVHLAGLALDAARAHAGAPAGPADVVARRRARRRLLRPRAWPSRAGGRPRWRARAARRPRTTCPP